MKYLLVVFLVACCFIPQGTPNYFVNNQRAINLYDADVDCSLSISSGQEPTAYALYETGNQTPIVSDYLAREKVIRYLLLSNQTYVVIVYDMHGKPYSRHVINAIKGINYVVDID
jgi:hypothetical protein